MLSNVYELAPAKLNLTLRVLPKRADGFHNIESIFQKIRLCDELTVTRSASAGCSLQVHGMELPAENTVQKAFSLFAEVAEIREGIAVDLVKHIPSGAGMGGGSSDAAALLRALNSLFSANVPQKVLVEIAEKIGSDVPFFLYGDCAIVSGRGEIVRPIEGRRDLYFVVICPDVHSSTKEAYGLVDEWNMNNTVSKVEWPSLDELEGIYKRPADKWVFANSFTQPLISRYPEIQRALAAITDVGADFADMTGSGSTVFGVFEAKQKAQDAYNRLASCFKRCYLCDAF
ncbi:MAG: 4-(cytidine 5'-diphospho)-2-C-methyl-D-erythritol kinase [Spirochaetaceae bacterium]|nr:4-(cytidine 5'-diphospho)-2-C-methyl-D-erythritol kinase [Spirochaetaceae bacterium]